MDKKKKDAKIKIDNQAPLELCITERPLMLHWISHLASEFALGSFNFWLETQNFKYLRDQSVLEQEAKELYNKYFAPKGLGINIDDDNLILDLNQKIVTPQRTTFMLVQNAIWGLLKFELFPRFQVSPNFKLKISKTELKNVIAKHDYSVKMLDKFLANNIQTPMQGGFRPHVLPDDFYEEHLHTTLPVISEIWKDGDFFLAFREFLYQRFANESLSFYMAASHYETLSEKEYPARAKEIYDTFVAPGAPIQINIGKQTTQQITADTQKPNKNTFKVAKDLIWKALENEWFPNFLVSPIYADCNKETLVYTCTGTRQRSETLTHYSAICKRPIKDPYVITQGKK